MKKGLLTGLIVLSMVLCSTMAAMAWDYNSFGDNITIYDGNGDGTGWRGAQEDNEVEPGAQSGQRWDMEAFFWNNGTQTLTMVGGYDLINGVVYSGYDRDRQGIIDPGYLFIDSGNNGTWDYAIAWNYTPGTDQGNDVHNLTTTLYNLAGGSDFINATDFQFANPWRYDVTGITGTDVTASYYGFDGSTNLSGVATDTEGIGHNAIGFDLSSLTLGTGFKAHFTIECGNDLILGETNTVPIPGAVWLLGSGLAGLFGVRRRSRK